MTSLALFLIRCVVGGLLAGHGAQKLFGAFGGGGPDRTAAYLSSLSITPPKPWARVAGLSEFAGGGLTMLGLLNPIGPMLALGSMATATLTQHKDKPIWGTQGGAELPVTNMAALAALVLAGPGRISFDTIFRTRVPWWFSFLALAGVGVGVASAIAPEPMALPAPKPETERVGGPVPWNAARREADLSRERTVMEGSETEATR